MTTSRITKTLASLTLAGVAFAGFGGTAHAASPSLWEKSCRGNVVVAESESTGRVTGIVADPGDADAAGKPFLRYQFGTVFTAPR